MVHPEQTVGYQAFGEPKSLESVHFGPGLQSLSNNIFYALSLDDILDGELEVYFEGTTPPQDVLQYALVYQHVSNGWPATLYQPVDFKKIHVPSGCKDSYVTKLGSVFEDKIVADL